MRTSGAEERCGAGFDVAKNSGCRIRRARRKHPALVNEFLTVLTAVLPIFCIAGSGVLLRQLNWLTADADASLLRVTVNVLTPCLIFDSILGNEAFAQPGNVWLPPLVGLGTLALGVPFAMLLRGTTGLRDEQARRTFTFVVSAYNYGYMPIPPLIALSSPQSGPATP